MAVVCQLWCWLGPLAIGPLVVRFTSARHSAFLRSVTGEVLNLQLVAAALTGAVVVAVLANLDFVARSEPRDRWHATDQQASMIGDTYRYTVWRLYILTP